MSSARMSFRRKYSLVTIAVADIAVEITVMAISSGYLDWASISGEALKIHVIAESAQIY